MDVEILEVAPPVPAVAPRVVGPGRRERTYVARIAALEAEIAVLEVVERGSSKRLDRMEQKEHRLILALGALQKENEMLRERLAPALPPARAERRSWLARLLSRAP